MEPNTQPTQSGERVSQGLDGVRQKAKENKQERFTALFHHVTPKLLEEIYYALKRKAAPGVDGVTWKEYGTGLAERLNDLHGRVHRGAYRAQPSRRIYIAKANGKQRPLGIAALDALYVALKRKKVNWVLDIDIKGFFNTCRAAHAYLRKPGAVVVTIGANHSHIAYPLQAHVCAAKAGVEMLTRVLAMEWGPEGIRVLGITPGPIDGTEGMRRLAPTPEARRAVCETVPLGRMGTTAEVADLATFLCSPAASYLTGAMYACDGGSGLAGPRSIPFQK